MSVIKAVMFDLDDTLWPIMPAIERAENLLFQWLTEHAPEVARRVSIDSMRERRQALMATDPVYQLDLRALRYRVLKEAFVDSGQDVALVDEAMAVFSRARNEVTLFEDVLPIFSHLQDRVLLGSVSNGMADLQTIGVAHFFRVSIAAYRFGRAKPDASIFHAACDALGVMPHEAVYVGDDPLLDVEGAKNAGMQAIWMNRPELEPVRMLPAHVQPDAICTTLYEFAEWLGERKTNI